MGQVLLKYQIMPESAEQDMEALKAGVTSAMESVDIRGMSIKPIAFGLKALEVIIVMPDASGTDALEASLESLEGVQSVKVLAMDLL
ncbi:MAG: elongation factor 1-beta [Thermoplasmata archaeon]|nr:elongation factor 1-beta [Thermoplasmata archaeon]